MPGPRKFKATKIGVIITTDISEQLLHEMFTFFDRLYIKFEVVKDKSTEELITYSSLAKRHGLETLIVVANASDTLPARCAKSALIPLIFAPMSGRTKTVPAKPTASAPFATVTTDKPLYAAIYASRIVAIRDKSLARRLLSINIE